MPRHPSAKRPSIRSRLKNSSEVLCTYIGRPSSPDLGEHTGRSFISKLKDHGYLDATKIA